MFLHFFGILRPSFYTIFSFYWVFHILHPRTRAKSHITFSVSVTVVCCFVKQGCGNTMYMFHIHIMFRFNTVSKYLIREFA